VWECAVPCPSHIPLSKTAQLKCGTQNHHPRTHHPRVIDVGVGGKDSGEEEEREYKLIKYLYELLIFGYSKN
jgi:hypothetical protein